jgi:cyclase
MNYKILLSLTGVVLLTISFAQNFDSVQIRTTNLTGSVYMLEGSGGNIGVCIGTDGPFIIDDQFAPLTENIKTAIATRSSG